MRPPFDGFLDEDEDLLEVDEWSWEKARFGQGLRDVEETYGQKIEAR